MKLAKLLDEGFTAAFIELKSQRHPIKAAYAIKGIDKAIEAELVKYEEMRSELLLTYSTKSETGEPLIKDGHFVLEGENRSQFIKELTELVNVDVMVGSIAIADLGDNATISTNALIQLEGLVN